MLSTKKESSGLHPAPLVTSTDGGAASASDGDSKAPHTHLATDPRGKRVKRPGGVAAEQAPQPSPRAASPSQRHFRSKLPRVQRKLHGASHRFGLIHYLQIIISYICDQRIGLAYRFALPSQTSLSTCRHSVEQEYCDTGSSRMGRVCITASQHGYCEGSRDRRGSSVRTATAANRTPTRDATTV